MTNANSKLEFAKDELTKIELGADGKISFSQATKFLLEIQDNAFAIESLYGNGSMGHAHLVLAPADYNIISGNMPYVQQAHPGP